MNCMTCVQGTELFCKSNTHSSVLGRLSSLHFYSCDMVIECLLPFYFFLYFDSVSKYPGSFFQHYPCVIQKVVSQDDSLGSWKVIESVDSFLPAPIRGCCCAVAHMWRSEASYGKREFFPSIVLVSGSNSEHHAEP